MAIFIDISATLKIGKLIGTISRKSRTNPLKSLSIPLPIVPPKRYESPIKFQDDLGGNLNIRVINNNDAKILVTVRIKVESLKRLNAAPLFFTRVKFNKLGIIIADLPNPKLINNL